MAEIAISDIVSNTLDGTGIFDVLMTAVELRISQQYDAGKIKGNDYASVYLGAMQSVLAQSISFTLGKQQADKQADSIEAQTALLAQKKLTEEAQVKDTLSDNTSVVDVDVNGNETYKGLVGRQQRLYSKQAEGFDRNAEVKVAKVFTDLWTVAKSTDSDATALALPLNVDQSSMDVILAKLATAAGLATQTDLGTPSSETATFDIDTIVHNTSEDIEITTTLAHGLSTGDAVGIDSVSGMIEINGNNYVVTVTGVKTFTLDNTFSLTTGVHTAGTGIVTVL